MMIDYALFFGLVGLALVPSWTAAWTIPSTTTTLPAPAAAAAAAAGTAPRTTLSAASTPGDKSGKGKILVLGGTGFLGQEVCKRALLEGYDVTSLSRRGLPPPATTERSADNGLLTRVDHRQGDARKMDSLVNILSEGGYTGIVHCIGLLLDSESGLGDWNKFASGSGSLPDSESTYDAITRQTAFNAIDAAMDYSMDAQRELKGEPMPFCFTSAAEAGWPDVAGGALMERLSPDFLKRYLAAKRTVERKLIASHNLRPIIVRPSLIYSVDRPASYLPVGAFFLLNAAGAPFVDRPVTVQSLAKAMVRSIGDSSIKGILRQPEIDRISR